MPTSQRWDQFARSSLTEVREVDFRARATRQPWALRSASWASKRVNIFVRWAGRTDPLCARPRPKTPGWVPPSPCPDLRRSIARG